MRGWGSCLLGRGRWVALTRPWYPNTSRLDGIEDRASLNRPRSGLLPGGSCGLVLWLACGIAVAQDFTGWRTYDIELFGRDGVPIPGYHGLAIHGRCGPMDGLR